MPIDVRYGPVTPPPSGTGKDGKPGKDGEAGESGVAGEQGEQGLPPSDPVPHMVDLDVDFINIDYRISRTWRIRLLNDALINFVPPIPTGMRVRVELYQWFSAPWTVIWGGDVRWPGDVIPTLATATDHIDIFEIEAWNDADDPPRNMGIVVAQDINLMSLV